MSTQKTIAQSIREEVERHRGKVLKLEESTRRVAGAHHCPDPSLIRLALLRRSMEAQTVLKL